MKNNTRFGYGATRKPARLQFETLEDRRLLTAATDVALRVDLATGDATMVFNGSQQIASYEIDSPSGQLVPVNWQSLDSQGHAGWTTLSNSANVIAEGNLLGSLSNDITIDLGNIFAGKSAGDLAFSWSDASNNLFTSSVTYVGAPVGVATTTALTASPNPSVFGQSVTFTATVAAVGSAAIPTGSVQFVDGTTNLGSMVSLDANGTATLDISTLGVGSHQITAVYAGDGNFTASTTTTPLSETVNQAAASVAIASSQNPAGLGQSVTITATVSAVGPGAGTPGGTVQFVDGTINVGGPVSLDGSGHAALSLSTLSVGSHNLTAVYSGDTDFTAATSPQLQQSITTSAKTTSTTVTAALKSSVFGQAITFTAQVKSPAGGTPGGMVVFRDGGNDLGSVALKNGRASLTTAALGVGSHSITVVYQGDANYGTSTSAALNRTVNKAASKTTMSVSTANSVVGQPITLKATVRAVGPGAGTPGGTVQFVDGTTNLGSPVSLAGGTATLSVSTLGAGVHHITVVYAGDGNFNGSRAASATETVKKVASTVRIASSQTPSTAGRSITLTATVTTASPGPGAAGGTVQFMDGGKKLGAPVALDITGHATLDVSTLSIGRHSLRAIYSGDPSFVGSQSGAIVQVVNKPAGDDEDDGDEGDDRESANASTKASIAPSVLANLGGAVTAKRNMSAAMAIAVDQLMADL